MSFRSKPVGWRWESYRHYLAAKGIRTRYFVEPFFKDPRETALGGLTARYLRGTTLVKEAMREQAAAEGAKPYQQRLEEMKRLRKTALTPEEEEKLAVRLKELGRRRVSAGPWLTGTREQWQYMFGKASADAASELDKADSTLSLVRAEAKETSAKTMVLAKDIDESAAVLDKEITQLEKTGTPADVPRMQALRKDVFAKKAQLADAMKSLRAKQEVIDKAGVDLVFAQSRIVEMKEAEKTYNAWVEGQPVRFSAPVARTLRQVYKTFRPAELPDVPASSMEEGEYESY